jgi:hypothetical protein
MYARFLYSFFFHAIVIERPLHGHVEAYFETKLTVFAPQCTFQEEVPFALFAVEWFTTLFVYNLPLDAARVTLSLLLVEGGLGFTVQLGVALLHMHQAGLVARRFDTLVPWLKGALIPGLDALCVHGNVLDVRFIYLSLTISQSLSLSFSI